MPADVIRCIEAAQEKQAEDLVVLDLRGLSDVTDFFLICHGNSDRQVGAIVENVDARLRAAGSRPSHVEGERGAQWVLMDYIDFVVHVFAKDKRGFYRLERLWGDAPRVEVDKLSGASGTTRGKSRPA